MSPAVAHSLRMLAALIAVPLLASAASAAPTSAQQSAIKSSCQGDYRANCASVPPGGSAALQCLQQNLGKLSPACQQAVTAASGGGVPAPTAANPPPPAAPGTPPPKAAAPAAKAPPPPPPMQMSPRQEAMLVRQYCRADFARYCSTVRLGAGNAAACLRANATRLSRGCQQALAAAMR